MNSRIRSASVALASVCLFAGGTPAWAAPVPAAPSTAARQTTRLAVDLVADTHLARQALVEGNTGNAEREIDRALAIRNALATSAQAKGTPAIVPLYAEFDKTTMRSGAQALSQHADEAGDTYLAIDLNTVQARLNAAKLALRNHHDLAARDLLAGIGSDLVQKTIRE